MLIKWRVFRNVPVFVRADSAAWLYDDRRKRTQNVHFPHAPLFVETRKFHRKRTAAAAAETGAETAAAPWQQRQHQSKKLLNTRIMFKMFIMCASDASSFPAPWQAPLLDDRPKRQANTHT